jgi:hypothetical protein
MPHSSLATRRRDSGKNRGTDGGRRFYAPLLLARGIQKFVSAKIEVETCRGSSAVALAPSTDRSMRLGGA